MTLMVNRSDRRFQTLSPTRAREVARLIENEARGNLSRPGPHLMPDKQAGYMTATEFHIASALQPLRAGGVHIWLADDAVRCEPLSSQNSLLNREITGNFADFCLHGTDRRPKMPLSA